MKRLLFLLLFASVVFAAVTPITTNPQYWNKNIVNNGVAAMTEVRVEAGNSTIPHGIRGGLGGTSSPPSHNAVGNRFFAYNDSAELNVSAEGKLILNGFAVRANTDAVNEDGDYYVKEMSGSDCTGATLATGTVHIQTSTWSNVTGLNVLLQAGTEYCAYILASVQFNTLTPGLFLGSGIGSNDEATWAAYAGGVNHWNFTEWYPVSSPRVVNNVTGDADFAVFRDEFSENAIDTDKWDVDSGSPSISSGKLFINSATMSSDDSFEFNRLNARFNSTTDSDWVVGFRAGNHFAALVGGDNIGQAQDQVYCLAFDGASFTFRSMGVLVSANMADFTVEWLPDRVNCYHNGDLKSSVVEDLPNPAQNLEIRLQAGGTDTIVFESILVENEMPKDSVVNLWANGTGRYDWASNENASWFLYNTTHSSQRFIAPLGWEFSSANRTFTATQANFGVMSLNASMSNSSLLDLPIVLNGDNNQSFTASTNSSLNATVSTTFSVWDINEVFVNRTTFENNNASWTYTNNTPPSWMSFQIGLGFVGDTERAPGEVFNVSTVPVPYNRTDAAIINWTFDTNAADKLTLNVSYDPLIVYTTNFSLMNCSFLSSTVAMNFSTFWEENLTRTVASQAASFSFVESSTGNEGSVGLSVEDTEFMEVCLYPSFLELLVTSFQEYFNDSSRVRHFFLNNASVNNVTSNVSLLVPTEANVQFIEVSVKDTGGNPLPGVFVTFQRFFPDLDAYVQVADVQTSASGVASTWLRTNDAFYNFIVTNSSGGVLQTFLQQIIPCDPTASSCPLNLFISLEELGEAYTVSGSTAFSCDVTEANVTCVVEDTSGLAQGIFLNVTQQGILTSTQVCSNSIASSSGTLFCNATDLTKLNSWSLYIQYNPVFQGLDSGYLVGSETQEFGLNGIFAMFMLVLAMYFVGSWNPAVSLGLVGLAFIMGVFLQIFTVDDPATVVGALVILVVFAYKMRT